ncbi:MAG: carnitine-CoA ligase [Actinomycetota bacterium]
MGTPARTLPPEQRTLPTLLELAAARWGDRQLVREVSGGSGRTFAAMRDRAAGYAGRLAEQGIAAGDRVAVTSENRVELLDLWLGCAWLGAVLVPVNTALRGPQLAHVLGDSDARLLVAEQEQLGALAGLEAPPPALERLWVLGEASEPPHGLRAESFPAPGDAVPPHPTGPGDPCLILYTSGTTGPSKGVLCPHAQWYWWAVKTGGILGVGDEDVLYTCLPLFHTNALNTFVQALTAGATFCPGPRFSARTFWQRLAESQATVTYLLGAMVHILSKRPPDAFERSHRTRIALAPATPAPLLEPFRERFGIELVDAWGSTETNVVMAAAPGTGAPPGSLGTVVDGFEARVVDEHDEELPAGVPGELVVRSDHAFAFASGYHGLPEQTVEAWRNLWFHTGDRVVRDEGGYFHFVDRLKDSIRRRGENISSFEVESVLVSHPDVAAAAVVPVPSELGEDEVLACVVLREGSRVAAADLLGFCEPRLAYFAVPRYVELLDELPLTASGKVEKHRLRTRGVSATTWDREAAGYVLRR